MSTPSARRQAVFEARVLAQLVDLRARVERLEARPRRAAVEDDGALLSAVAFMLGASVFSAADLWKLARHNPELAAVINGDTPRSLGLRLRRLAREPIAGYRLMRIKRESRGQLWILELVCR